MPRTPAPTENVAQCHSSVSDTLSYDPDDAECLICPDKFSCLPIAIEKKQTEVPLSADKEVEAVERGFVSVEDVILRMKRRYLVITKGKPVPKDLAHDSPSYFKELGVEEDEPDHAIPESVAVVAEVPESPPEMPPKPVAKPKPPRATSRKKPTKKAKAALADPHTMYASADGDVTMLSLGTEAVARLEVTPEGFGWWSVSGDTESQCWFDSLKDCYEDYAEAVLPEGITLDKTLTKRFAQAPKKPRRKAVPKPPVAAPTYVEGWPVAKNGKPYPRPRTLTEAEMVTRVEALQTALDTYAALDFGTTLRRRMRNGDVVSTTITRTGFEYELPTHLVEGTDIEPVQLFATLSAIAHWSTGHVRSGNDFFNVSQCASVEISQGGIVVDSLTKRFADKT